MTQGRRMSHRLPTRVDAHSQRLARRVAAGSGPVVLTEQPMAGRLGCHVSLQAQVSTVTCLGYPLAVMGNRDKRRDPVLLEMTTPVLFLQGSRDTLRPLDLLGAVRPKMSAPNALLVTDLGVHSPLRTKTWLKETRTTKSGGDDHLLAERGEWLTQQL